LFSGCTESILTLSPPSQGQSGSGKSTIVGLIERWYNPDSGVIKLDGRPIDQLNLSWLRQNIRLVQQEPVLFRGSVFDNIAHGLVGTQWENSSKEEKLAQVQIAAKMAFAHDFITELPEGYETQIGQRGGLLSGGQKQRIAIARSVVSQPKILLLDEATSALDSHAEGIVQQALDRASEGRTTIVIAHKLATIRKANNIVVMSKGHIVEQGTHEHLMTLDQHGVYAKLVRIQSLGVPEEASSDLEDVVATGDEQPPPAYLTQTATKHSHHGPSTTSPYSHPPKSLFLTTVIYRLICRTSRSNQLMFSIVLISCLFCAAAFPGQALLLGSMMDVFTLTGSELESRGAFFATMFIVLACGLLLSYGTLGWSSSRVAQALTHQLRRESLDYILRQDLEFFDREENSTGALASRVDANPQAVFELMGINVALILVSVVNVAACSALAIAHSWKIGLVVVFGGLPPLIGSGFMKIRSDVKLDKQIEKRQEASASIAGEAITAIRTISSLAIEDDVLERYMFELDEAVKGSVRPMSLMMLWFAFTQGVEYWFMALGFWYGCRLLSFGEVSMYDFMVAFLGVFFSGQAASQFFQFSTSTYLPLTHELEVRY